MLVAGRDVPHPEPGFGIPLREAGDLAGGALLGRVVLVAMDREAMLTVPGDEAVAAGVLIRLRAVVSELRKSRQMGAYYLVSHRAPRRLRCRSV
jgi:hypothetical protein